MRNLSIKKRVTLWYALMMLIIVLVLFAFIFYLSDSMLHNESESRLSAQVHEFAEEIEFEDGGWELDDDQALYQNDITFCIYDSEGRPATGSCPEGFPADTELKSGSFQTFSNDYGSWESYDIALKYNGGNKILWVRGIISTQTIFTMEKTMVRLLFIACPALILIAILVGYYITKHALKPVEKIRQTAEEIGAGGDLSKRIPTDRAPEEILRLAESFNNMFERLEDAFSREHQFTSDASHELRTPVAVITSNAEYALMTDATYDEQRESLSVILAQAGKMSSLISQLLTLARTDSGSVALNKEEVDLSTLTLSVSEEYEEKAAVAGIRIIADIKPDVHVYGDRDALMRALGNLIDNAIHYGKERGHIWITLTGDKGKAELIVRDDGIGIEAKDQEKIFRRFFRVDPSRNPAGSNTGLGLSMVQWIAAAHNGSISVSSSPGKGSTFTLELPGLF